jgi:hypothetical protein
MNLALALALTARQEFDDANGDAAEDLVSWNDGKIAFRLCPPDKIDVQAVIRQVM